MHETTISRTTEFIGTRLKVSKQRPLLIGVTGCQGSGKSTLCNRVSQSLSADCISNAVVSIDDFYLNYDSQISLARHNPRNKLWQHRGEPGTHDINLADRTLDSLLSGSGVTKVPMYDKSLHGGRGDRAPEEQWCQIANDNLQVVIFEGWMVGFRYLSLEQLRSIYNKPDFPPGHEFDHLVQVNEALKSYQVLFDKLDGLVELRSPSVNTVYKWRLEQEHTMIKSKGKGMSDEQVKGFIDGYMPAYHLYLDQLHSSGITKSLAEAQLVLQLDENRNLISSHTQ